MKTRYSKQIVAALGSWQFFWLIIAVLVLQAAWIAASGRYPMAFDEDFHLGVIRLYAHHLSPFWGTHPAAADAFGAVNRDPSYLYHYLLSFPYRLIAHFTADQTIQVMVLRSINIGLMATALVLYRKLLLFVGASRALTNTVLLLFVLLPIVSLLAAQINYDNFLLALTAASLLFVARFGRELDRYQRFNVVSFGGWALTCMFASLVKYAFLPIALSQAAYVGYRLYRTYPNGKKLWLSIGFGISLVSRRLRWLLLVCLMILSVLSFERYGLNLVHYHTPVPDCGQVLTVRQCSAYGPWARDYNLALAKDAATTSRSPLRFTASWFDGMWVRTYFSVDGPATKFQTRGPLTVPALSGIVLGLLSAGTLIFVLPRLWRSDKRPVIVLFAVVSIAYVGILWLDEYRAFLRTGQPVAINGRYLLPIMPLLLVTAGWSFRELFGAKREVFKLGTVSIATVCLLWGGGAMTYVLRSSNAWYWPSTPLKNANHTLQQSLGPITPGYHYPTQYLP
jgi:hypothetical protein